MPLTTHRTDLNELSGLTVFILLHFALLLAGGTTLFIRILILEIARDLKPACDFLQSLVVQFKFFVVFHVLYHFGLHAALFPPLGNLWFMRKTILHRQ